MLKHVALVLLFLIAVVEVIALPEDHPALRSAMEMVGLHPTDFFVDPALRRRDLFRLNKIDEFMRHPLRMPDYLQGLAGDLANCSGAAEATHLAGEALELKIDTPATPPVKGREIMLTEVLKAALKAKPLFSESSPPLQSAIRNPKSALTRDGWKPVALSRALPPEVATITARLLTANLTATEVLRSAFSDLSPQQLKKLRTQWRDLCHWIRGQENVNDFDLDLLVALRAVDLSKIVSVGISWLKEVDGAVAALEAWKASPASKTFRFEGILLDQATPLGRVVIGGTGDNHYTSGQPPCLLIELGGNDRYEIPLGSGYEGVAVAIDLAGDDRYQCEREATAGAGVLGLGALIDCEGNDRYETGDTSAGVACVGVGVLSDLAGDDDYHCGEASLGAACYGVGLLLEESGHDNYVGTHYSQGVSFTLGFGALIDRAGNDTYLSGRKLYGWSTSENTFSAGGQGFSWGVREYSSGGIGLLVDVSGDDSYYGNNLAQGMGYWYGLGALIDGGGNDQYFCKHYGQGCGVHFGLGVLLDNAGNDIYNGSVTTGGNGYDRSLGILIDYAGNDFHRHEHISGGAGMYAGCGLFCDQGGNDAYQGGVPGALSYGSGQIDRDRVLGAIGVFLDLGGKDHYIDRPMSDGGFWQQGEFGVAVDTEAPPLFTQRFAMKPRPSRPSPTESTYDAKQLPPKSKVEELYRKIADPYATQKTKDETIAAFLKLPHEETLPFLMQQLVRRPFYPSFGSAYDLIPKFGASAVPVLEKLLMSPDAEERDRAVDMLRDITEPASLPALRKALQDASHQVRLKAVYALGQRKDIESVGTVTGFLKDAEPWMRGAAAQSLQAMASSILVPPKELLIALETALKDDFWATRYYSARALGMLGDPGWTILNKLTTSSSLENQVVALTGIGLMISSPRTAEERKVACRSLLLEKMKETDAHLRNAAAHALALTKDKSLLEFLKILEPKETDAEVRYALQASIRALSSLP